MGSWLMTNEKEEKSASNDDNCYLAQSQCLSSPFVNLFYFNRNQGYKLIIKWLLTFDQNFI